MNSRLSKLVYEIKNQRLTEGDMQSIVMDLMTHPVTVTSMNYDFDNSKATCDNDELIDLVNYRIEQEEISSRLYLAMSIWLDHNGYVGAGKLWKKYSEEEASHAQWSYKYLLDLDIKPDVPALPKPQCDFQGLPDIIMKSYEHELQITKQCQVFAQRAQAAGDYMTLDFAQKFLREQVDEIAKTTYWIDRLEAFGTEKVALRMLDDEMSQH